MLRDPGDQSLEGALVRYLIANPHACDTAEGIARWWLAGRPLSLDALRGTLGRLAHEGVLEELRAADGRLRYRRLATDDRLHALVADKAGMGSGP